MQPAEKRKPQKTNKIQIWNKIKKPLKLVILDYN